MRQSWSRRSFLQSVGASGAVIVLSRLAVARERESGGELHFHSRSPNNAEPHLAKLDDVWITPVEHFYIRSHGPNPEIDEAAFTVSVEGMVRKPLTLKVGQIREQFPQQTVTATLTCAGNRRDEHSATKPVAGVPWGPGAIGNATWGGVTLADILRRAELAEGAGHVWFDGADEVVAHGEKMPFGGSIPLEKAMSRRDDIPGCLVAWQMNGEALQPDHGFPVRTVVPGYIGARSVKWLRRIVVSDRPSPNHFVAEAYKLLDEETPEKQAQAEPIYQYPINAAICEPADGAKADSRKITVSGYALAPGEAGRTIRRVEVSMDDGKTWREARLEEHSAPYCWRLWSAEVELSAGAATLVVRATDSTGQAQPPTTPWNVKGYLYNGWHKRKVDA
jgi:sulfite oxidase